MITYDLAIGAFVLIVLFSLSLWFCKPSEGEKRDENSSRAEAKQECRSDNSVQLQDKRDGWGLARGRGINPEWERDGIEEDNIQLIGGKYQ